MRGVEAPPPTNFVGTSMFVVGVVHLSITIADDPLFYIHPTPINTNLTLNTSQKGGKHHGKSKKHGIKNLHFRRYRSYGG